LKSRLIIIVDDSPHVAASLEVALESVSGVRLTAASNGADALKIVNASANIAAVITDLEMPGMDGFELIRKIRERSGQQFPIIVTSGKSDPNAPADARRAGADAYFAKPYSPAALRTTLEGLLSQGA